MKSAGQRHRYPKEDFFFMLSNRFQRLYWKGCREGQQPGISETIFAFLAIFKLGPLEAQNGSIGIF